MRLSRRKPKGQIDFGFIARPVVFCFPCRREYRHRNFAAHLASRDHKRSVVRQNPTPRWRKPRVLHPHLTAADYEDRMWAEQEAREREDEASRMPT